MGGKSGGGARTPVIWANTAHSAQRLKVIDLISSGEIFSFQHGNDEPLKSIYLNGTPIQNADGTLNFGGVRAEFNRGTVDQDYMPSFGSVDKAVEVATQVKKDRPISRTVTNSQATSVRVTVGVDALVWSTLEGDQWPTTAELHVQLVKNNVIHSSKLFSIYEKGNKPYRQDIVFDDLPEAPFEIRCVREMVDSNDDMLKNDTYFFSYVESIDAKMRYPLSAVVGLEIDSEQFGDGIPERTYGIKGCIVQVPSNYDPETRTYTGLWDRLFKPAWTNNPVWILYDLLTDEVDGFNALNKGIKIDIDNFYSVAKYCDELVDDGNGGKEPRFVCNAVFYGEDAYTAINNLCSSFRAVCGYNGEYLTLYTDRAHDVVRIYNNSMVVDGLFDYAETELSQRYNQVQVQWVDAENGYETTIDEVSDEANIATIERIITLSIVAFGATKLSYARRAALWALITSLTETVVVSFKVGASGIYHEIYDIIEIADNDYMGTMAGGRIKAINGNVITLDREVNNALEFSIETKSGPRNFDVKRQISETEYELTLAPEIIESASFNAILKDVEPRLFRCTNIEENDDGTYTVSAIQHNPQKEAIVDRGAEYTPSKTTVINSVPGLSNGIVNNDGRAIILEWDSLSVIGTENRYRIQLFKDKALYKTFETKETSLRLENLPQGEYIAKIRAVNSSGQHSEELVIAFSTTYIIDGLRAKPIVFGIELRWQLPALITSDASTEIWYSEKDDRMTATRLTVVPYPQSNYFFDGLSVGESYFFWFRLVDRAGNDGEFSHSIKGSPVDNTEDILSQLDNKIGEKQISQDLKDQFDKNIGDKIKESEIVINESIGKLELDNEKININIEKLNTDNVKVNSNIEKLNIDDVLKDISLMNEGYTRRSQDAVLEANVADAFAQIKETDTVIVNKTEVLAQKDTQLEASINDNKADIKRVEQVAVDEKQSQAVFKEDVNTKFNENEADATLSLISLSTESITRSQQDLMLSANVAGAHAEIEETKTVIAEEKRSQAEVNTELTSRVNQNSAQIKANTQTQADDHKALTQEINSAKSEIAGNKAEISEIKITQVDDRKAVGVLKDDVRVLFDKNEADATLSLITLATEAEVRSQQDLKLSANVVDAHAQIEETKTVVADAKKAQAEINTDIKSEIAENSAQIKFNAQTQVDDKEALTKQINSANSEIGKNKAEIEGVKVTVADNKKAQAELEEQVTAKFNENEAGATLSLISLATEGVTRSQQDLMLKANVGSAQADIEETKGVIAEAKEAQAEINTTLTSKVNNNEAQIKANAQTQATDKATLTQEINSANSKIGKNEAEISQIKTTQVNDQKAISALKSETSARFDKNEADQILENISLTTEGYSSASQYSVISVNVAGNSSSIQELNNTFSDFNGTMSEQITQLQSKTNDHQSQIVQISETQTDTEGRVNALWTLKVDANGAIGGIMLGSDGKESQFKVAADSFIVSSGNQEKNLFIIQRVNGQDVASLNVTDFIIDGSVSAKKFNAESFEGYTITGVEINAGHFYGGSIAIGGTKEDPNFSVGEDGKINAKEGYFGGTIEAKMIKGDIGQIINIPAIRYESLLMWGSRTFIKRFDPVPWERNLQVISSWFINQMNGTFHAGNTFRVSEIRNGVRKVLVESSDERIDIYKQGDFIHIPPNVTFSIEIYQSAPTSYTGEFARSNAVKLVDIRSGVVDVEFEVIE